MPLSSTPKPCGLPGCMATLSNRTRSPSSTSRTTSYAPTLTPPVHTTTSAPASAAAARVARKASASSATRPVCTTCAPASVASPPSRTLFDSGIWPRRSGSPAETSSLPVETMASRTRRRTTTSAIPAAASAASRKPVSSSPACTTMSPATRSVPRRRMCCPRVGAIVTSVRVSESASPAVVCSTGTTASASLGTGEPVMMRAASPERSSGSSLEPAGRSATTRRATGASAVA